MLNGRVGLSAVRAAAATRISPAAEAAMAAVRFMSPASPPRSAGSTAGTGVAPFPTRRPAGLFSGIRPMDELVNQVAQRTGVGADTVRKVLTSAADFIKQKLPPQ